MSDTAAAPTKQAPSVERVLSDNLVLSAALGYRGTVGEFCDTIARRQIAALEAAGYMVIGKAEFRALIGGVGV